MFCVRACVREREREREREQEREREFCGKPHIFHPFNLLVVAQSQGCDHLYKQVSNMWKPLTPLLTIVCAPFACKVNISQVWLVFSDRKCTKGKWVR